MNHIAEVIGWKFDHQPGMATKDGVITEFPGGVPPQEDQDNWNDEYEAQEVPMIAWRKQMEATDLGIPRWFEDAVTERSVILKPGRVKDNYDEKVRLRGERP